MTRLNDALVPGSGLAYIDKRLIRDGDVDLDKFTQDVKDAIAAGGLTEEQVNELLADGDYTTSARVNTIVDNAVAHLPTTPVETVTETVGATYTYIVSQAVNAATWAVMTPSDYELPASQLMQFRLSIGTGTAARVYMSGVFDSKEILQIPAIADSLKQSGGTTGHATFATGLADTVLRLTRDGDNKPVFMLDGAIAVGFKVELLELEFPTTSGSATGAGGPAFRTWEISGAEKNIRFVELGHSGNVPADNLEIVRENLNGKRIVIGGTTTAASIRVILDRQGGGSEGYQLTDFLLDNQTNKTITEWYTAGGGGDGNAKFECPVVPPGAVARIAWVADASETTTNGIALLVEVYRGSVENIFPGLGTVPPQLTDYVLIGDVSNNEMTVKVTLQDLRGLIGGGGSVATHNRRCAIRAADGSAFVAGDFLTSSSGSRSITHIVTVPTWTSGKRQLAFAVPTSTPDLTGLRPNGSVFNAIGGFTKQTATLAIDGDTYKLWINPSVFQVTSGTAWEIEP